MSFAPPGSRPTTARNAAAGGLANLNHQTTSPRRSPNLTKSYLTRYTNGNMLADDPVICKASPRAFQTKKSALNQFTDPTNPYSRQKSKAMTDLDSLQGDTSRAGGRTRNPGMIPCENFRSQSVEPGGEGAPAAPAKLQPYRYSTDVAWRPSKKCPDSGTGATPESAAFSPLTGHSAQSPRQSSGVHESLGRSRGPPGGGGNALENYLNDMKKSAGPSKRIIDGQASEWYQRMNDTVSKLPSDRNIEVIGRARSCEPRMLGQGLHLLSSDENPLVASKDDYGFARKSLVAGNWTSGVAGLLVHNETPTFSAAPLLLQKSMKASQRFDEIVGHMNDKNPQQRQDFEYLKSRGNYGQGVFNREE